MEEDTEMTSCGYLQVMDKSLKEQFAKLGQSIAKNPVHYITVPILLSLLLGSGLQRFTFVNDLEYLFSPPNGEGRQERNIIENLFPMNYSSRFDPSRLTGTGRTARIYITAKDNGSLAKGGTWREIRELDQIIRKTQIEDNEDIFTYAQLCARWDEECFYWNILELSGMMDRVEAGNLSLSYPIAINPDTFETITLPAGLGGIELNNDSTVKSFKAVQLLYFINAQSPRKAVRGERWEEAVVKALAKVENDWQFIKADIFTWWTLGSEIDRNNLSVIPYASFAIPLMILFAAGTMIMKDWVRSKPWLGLVGFFCPVFGTLAAFGLLLYCGIPLCSINIAAPFLMMGIGIDDSFVMVAAWRQTSVHDSVPKRMAQTFAEAGVSITITSLTDMLSFWVGIAAPFPALQIFSVYTGTAVLGTYLCHVFIFGGAMALSGYAEAENKSGLLWWKTCTPKSKVESDHPWFTTGGVDPSDPFNPQDNKESTLMAFFRDYWAHYVNKPFVKILILVGFVLYMAVAGWGISQTKEGLDLTKLVHFNSYASSYFEIDSKYFRDFPYRIQVVITDELDYSNKTVQDQVEKMMKEFERSKYIGEGSLYTQSWLRSFLRHVEKWKTIDVDLNVTTERDFVKTLQEDYLTPEFILTDDIKFNDDKTKIVASRFILQAINVYTAIDDIEMVTSLRAIAKAQAPQLNVTVFNWYFIFLDQYLLTTQVLIQCICIAGIIMMVVSLILIPNPLCSLWVTFSIVSIETGILGFLALWNVNLDVISAMSIIMCIGFSVDFSAHISYAYMSATVETPDERVKTSLYNLGWAIVQGAVSTILGVLTLILVPSYIHNTFFKAVVLVMIIAAAHGLLLLPVLLSLFGPGSVWGKGCRRRESGEKEQVVIKGARPLHNLG